jgi:hypothetical protein
MFHNFKKKMNEKKSKDRDKSESDDTNNWAAISGAADLLDEVKDIMDELTILRKLVTQQLDVWQELVGNEPGTKSSSGPANTLRGVEEMIEMTDRVQQSVTAGSPLYCMTMTKFFQVHDILGLEQNGINIDQAQESFRQGTILMAFTIVTVVFVRNPAKNILLSRKLT